MNQVVAVKSQSFHKVLVKVLRLHDDLKGTPFFYLLQFVAGGWRGLPGIAIPEGHREILDVYSACFSPPGSIPDSGVYPQFVRHVEDEWRRAVIRNFVKAFADPTDTTRDSPKARLFSSVREERWDAVLEQCRSWSAATNYVIRAAIDDLGSPIEDLEADGRAGPKFEELMQWLAGDRSYLTLD